MTACHCWGARGGGLSRAGVEAQARRGRRRGHRSAAGERRGGITPGSRFTGVCIERRRWRWLWLWLWLLLLLLLPLDGSELILLQANHVQKPVDLGFLLVLQFLVQLAQAGLAVVAETRGSRLQLAGGWQRRVVEEEVVHQA